MTTARLLALIDDLRNQPAEQSCVEFKHNNPDPNMIGKLISALSNAATLTPEEFRAIPRELSVRDRALVLVAGSTGMRR